MSGDHYYNHGYPTSTEEDYQSLPASGYRTSYHAAYPASQHPQPGVHGSQTWPSQYHGYSSSHAAPTSQTSYYQPQGYYQPTPSSTSSYGAYPTAHPTYHSSYPAGYGEHDESIMASTEGLGRLSVPPSQSSRRSKSPGGGATRTWTCDIPDCPSTAQFTRLADLQRHQATVHHNEAMKPFPCTVPSCSRVGQRGFTRRDHLTEHLRSYHHLDIRKRRPGERSAGPL